MSKKNALGKFYRIFFLLCSIFQSHVYAAIITVTFSGDRNLYLATGETPRGDCSYREALHNAINDTQLYYSSCEAGSGSDKIVFAPGINNINLNTGAFGGPIFLSGAGQIEVEGHGPLGYVTINGGGNGGIHNVNNSTQVTIRYINFFRGNRAGVGGAILVEQGSVFLENTGFIENTAQDGGAIGIAGSNSHLSIKNSSFVFNKATGMQNDNFTGKGGAIWFSAASAELTNVRFFNNEAKLKGGAINCDSSSGQLSVYDLVANDNDFIPRSEFYGNITHTPNADIYGVGGGGAISSKCNLLVRNTLFENNKTAGKGGAVYIEGGSSDAYFEQVNFDKNEAFFITFNNGNRGLGGALMVEATGANKKIVINRSSLRLNKAVLGGGIYLRSARMDVLNSTIVSNRATGLTIFDTGGAGGGIYFSGPLENQGVRIMNTTLDNNSGADTLYFSGYPALLYPVSIYNTIINNTNQTQNCGGSVDTSTLNTSLGIDNIRFDLSDWDDCYNGDPDQAIPKANPGFVTAPVPYPIFPFVFYRPISKFSAAADPQIANPVICAYAGKATAGIIPLPIPRDEIGKLRDLEHCSLGAVEPTGVIDF